MKKLFVMAAVVSMLTGVALASATIEGTTLTFSVAEGVTETYDSAVPTDGTIKTIYKIGKGKMILNKAGGKDRTITVYIQEGVLELTVRGAFAAYNNIYISKGAQIYANNFEWSASEYKNWATLAHYFKGVEGNGPDGMGAIRVAAKYDARACIRNELTLTGDTTIYSDNDLELGISSGTTLNLKGHTLTFAGKGTTTFNTQQNSSVTVKPGDGGLIVIDTTRAPKLQGAVTFEGDATSKLTMNKSTAILVEDTVKIPWTIESKADKLTHSAGSFEKGTLTIMRGTTRLGNTIKIGGSNAGGALVVKSGASLIDDWNGVEIGSNAKGNTPALIKVEAGAVVSNKFVSTYTKGDIYKLSTQTWGSFTHVGSTYMANWIGYGFFGLEGGDMTLAAGAFILGMPGSHGLFQHDAGEFAFKAESHLSAGGRSDYLMRGGRIEATNDSRFNLCSESDKQDYDGDSVSLSMIGENAKAIFTGGVNLNQRTGGVAVAVNLNAGRFATTQLTLSGGTPAYLNMNGGTFVMPATANKYLISDASCSNLVTTIYGKGFTFELDRDERTFLTDRDLNPPTEASPARFAIRGVSGKGIKSVKVPSGMPRSGYLGIMPVMITNGDGDTTGRGAFAALDFNVAAGTIGEDLLILCPGCDYTKAPKVVAYGPDYTTAYECAVELTDVDQTPGAFVKTGCGELVLNTTNNLYAGPYIISNGTLMVNRWVGIPTTSKIRVAGGCFRWDWTSRTIGEFGGFGTFFGSRNDSMEKLTVTSRFVVDANDLNEGNCLCVDENTDDGTKYAKNDCVVFDNNCKVAIENVDKLAADTSTFVLLRQQTAINRVPELETPNPSIVLFTRTNGDYSELCLKRRSGLCIIVR